MQVIFIRCTKTETDSRTVVRVNKLMYYMVCTYIHSVPSIPINCTLHNGTYVHTNTESSLIQPVDMCERTYVCSCCSFFCRALVPFVSGRCSQAPCHETYVHMSVHMHVHFGTISAGTTHSTLVCVCLWSGM